MQSGSNRVDELKPPLPYIKGAQLHILPHLPPLPMGGHYTKPQTREQLDRCWEQYKTASELCLAHPPVGTPPPADQTVHRLNIVDQVACGDDRGPQVVTCCVDGEDVVRVAKIFDPLYSIRSTTDSMTKLIPHISPTSITALKRLRTRKSAKAESRENTHPGTTAHGPFR